jgi:hypothetical protein
MQTQLTKPQWCALSQETRNKLREIFKIKKSEGAEICSDKLVSDGTSHDDLMAISVETMQKYLGSKETDFAKLFEDVLDTMFLPVDLDEAIKNGDIEVIPVEIIDEEVVPMPAESIPDPIKDFLNQRSLNANQQNNEQTKEAGAE